MMKSPMKSKRSWPELKFKKLSALQEMQTFFKIFKKRLIRTRAVQTDLPKCAKILRNKREISCKNSIAKIQDGKRNCRQEKPLRSKDLSKLEKKSEGKLPKSRRFLFKTSNLLESLRASEKSAIRSSRTSFKWINNRRSFNLR